MWGDVVGKTVLLLQGPAGPFFRRLAKELRGAGARPLCVTFNAGDAMFLLGTETVAFNEPMDQWPAFLSRLVEDRAVDAIVLYGDMRPIHVAARELGRERNLPVYALEEGYLRPDYITVELGGVNGNSPMPTTAEAFLDHAASGDGTPVHRPARVGHTFAPAALWSTVHSMAVTILWFLYPHYVHHRLYNCWQHTFYWPRGGIRKFRFRYQEREILGRLSSEMSAKYFLVPLQVHCDAQLQHSRFSCVEEFVGHVVASFARSAPDDVSIVFKHHPADRPYTEYGELFRALAEKYSLGDRLLYVHDLHLPTLLKHAAGSVVINSTVGLSSLHHRTPVYVLGDAVYDVPGLVAGGSLDEFCKASVLALLGQERLDEFTRHEAGTRDR